MFKYLLAVCLLAPSFAFAKRKHGAHEHGVAKIDMVVEGSNASVMLRAPAESIFGFEHDAKTEGDKKQKEAGLETLRTKILEALGPDASLNCKIDQADVQHGKPHKHTEKKAHAAGKHEAHSDVTASYKLTCVKPLVGSVWNVDLKKIFPRIQTVELQGKRVTAFPAKVTL